MAGVYIPSSDHHMQLVNTESNKQEITKQFSKTAFNLKSQTRKKAECLIYIYIYIYTRGLLEKYPTFGREKETGLLGTLDT